jgi:hypothetical protein
MLSELSRLYDGNEAMLAAYAYASIDEIEQAIADAQASIDNRRRGVSRFAAMAAMSTGAEIID